MMRNLLATVLVFAAPVFAQSSGSWSGTSSGGSSPASIGVPSGDPNSLVPSRTDGPLWTSGISEVTRFPYHKSDGTYQTMVEWNNNGTVNTGVKGRWQVKPPTGCTGTATLTVPARRLNNVNYNGTLSRAKLTDGSDNVQLASVDLNLQDANVSTFTTSASVTAGTSFFVRLELLDPTYHVELGAVRLTPTCSSGFFSRPFIRYGIETNMLWDNARAEVGTGYWVPSSASRIIFETNADSFVAETLSSLDPGTSPTVSDALVFVDGEMLTTTMAIDSSSNEIDHETVTLPSSKNGKMKRVEIVHGFARQGDTTVDAVGMSVVRAVYFPLSSSTTFMMPIAPPPYTVLVLSDSTFAGTGTTGSDSKASVGQILRRGMPEARFTFDGVWAGNSVHQLAQSTARIQRYMGYWSKTRPNAVVIHLGTNDYGSSLSTAAVYGTRLLELVDAMRAAWPGVVIQMITPLKRTTETANGAGSTLGDYRTQVTAVATARGLQTPLDGSSLVTAADILDGVHPSDSDITVSTYRHGPGKIATAITTALRALTYSPPVAIFLPLVEANVPAEPITCALSTRGAAVSVNDLDDTTTAIPCMCISTDDNATFDWVRLDDVGTACPFF